MEISVLVSDRPFGERMVSEDQDEISGSTTDVEDSEIGIWNVQLSAGEPVNESRAQHLGPFRQFSQRSLGEGECFLLGAAYCWDLLSRQYSSRISRRP